MDCGCEDPHEVALAVGNYVEVEDEVSPLGFHFEFPNVIETECQEPGSRRHDPYARD